MKICDSSYLIAFLHPNPGPPKDRQDKPVTQFRERISALIEELSAANDIIGIPAPALAETLVRAGPNRAQYMKVLGDSFKFQLVPFDARAAIETAELIAAVKTNKDPWGKWGKVKFDIQIVATANAEGASVIYSDDRDIENYAKRFNIRVIRICDLPAPPPPAPATTPEMGGGALGPQMLLALEPPAAATPIEENEPASTPISEGRAASTPSDQLKTDPPHPVAVRGVDSGRAEDESASETGKRKG